MTALKAILVVSLLLSGLPIDIGASWAATAAAGPSATPVTVCSLIDAASKDSQRLDLFPLPPGRSTISNTDTSSTTPPVTIG
jgi:hypothetical protein